MLEREGTGKLTRSDYGVHIEKEHALVYDEGAWRKALDGETPSAWGAFDPDFGWIVTEFIKDEPPRW